MNNRRGRKGRTKRGLERRYLRCGQPEVRTDPTRYSGRSSGRAVPSSDGGDSRGRCNAARYGGRGDDRRGRL